MLRVRRAHASYRQLTDLMCTLARFGTSRSAGDREHKDRFAPDRPERPSRAIREEDESAVFRDVGEREPWYASNHRSAFMSSAFTHNTLFLVGSLRRCFGAVYRHGAGGGPDSGQRAGDRKRIAWRRSDGGTGWKAVDCSEVGWLPRAAKERIHLVLPLGCVFGVASPFVHLAISKRL